MALTLSPAAARRQGVRAARSRRRRDWFADLEFRWDGLIDRKTGRKIGAAELTPMELAKFLGYLGIVLLQSAASRLNGRARISVYFAPDTPRPWHVIWSAATLAGIRFAPHEAAADCVFYFEDKTYGAPNLVAGGGAVNGGCGDISKSYVAKVFEQIAGYPFVLDPTIHNGVAVEKSEDNGAHDGRLVQCPTAPIPGKAYQMFVDSADGDIAFDYRTTIIGRAPLFVLIKTKPAADRFSIHNRSVKFAQLDAVFSAAEIDLIARFAAAMQLDWAALDVLRDRITGRIYVVDVNKTDMGPAVDLSWSDRERLKGVIAPALLSLVKSRS
jgi:hypothetical protein